MAAEVSRMVDPATGQWRPEWRATGDYLGRLRNHCAAIDAMRRP